MSTTLDRLYIEHDQHGATLDAIQTEMRELGDQLKAWRNDQANHRLTEHPADAERRYEALRVQWTQARTFDHIWKEIATLTLESRQRQRVAAAEQAMLDQINAVVPRTEAHALRVQDERSRHEHYIANEVRILARIGYPRNEPRIYDIAAQPAQKEDSYDLAV